MANMVAASHCGRTRFRPPVHQSDAVVPQSGVNRLGFPSRRPVPAGTLRPRQGGAPNRTNDLDGAERSGGLWCVTGGRHGGWLASQRAGVRGRAPAAGGHLRVLGPEALAAGGIVLGPTYPARPGDPGLAVAGRGPGPQRRVWPGALAARRPGQRISRVCRRALRRVGAVSEAARRRARRSAACGRLEDVSKVLTGTRCTRCPGPLDGLHVGFS